MLKLFQFAYQTRRYRCVTHLLVDAGINDYYHNTHNNHSHNNSNSHSHSHSHNVDTTSAAVVSPQCYLLPVDRVYLGRWVNGQDGTDLEDLVRWTSPSPGAAPGARSSLSPGAGVGANRGATSRLPFVSSRYANIATSSSSTTSSTQSSNNNNYMLMDFFTKCGARKTIALTATTRNITTDELTSSPSFGGKMPTLRSSSTSVPLCYPYRLGELNGSFTVTLVTRNRDISYQDTSFHHLSSHSLATSPLTS